MILRLNKFGNRGIALIMVMMIVIVFAILAGGLAYSMKVETKLARNSSWDTELEWLGRSGIEFAKYVLSQSSKGGQYDALNQIWAGGTGETNDALEGMSLTDNQLGHGTFSVKITDADRKFNINLAVVAPDLVNQAMILMGVDAAEGPQIVAAISDWIDRDDQTRPGGGDTESDYYMSLKPPYTAKNGFIDDLTELMMIKGISPAMYYGSGSGLATANNNAGSQQFVRAANRFNRRGGEEPSYAVGFQDLFTAISGRFININTASATVLQLFPDLDGASAQAIIQRRAGPDGVEGNEDDMPFKGAGEVGMVPGMAPEIAQYLAKSPYVGVRSSTFEVQVDVQIDSVKRTYYAVLRRAGGGQPNQQLVLLYMYWR
ncbi:MAG TPA: type II secretion system protein GspK [Candidatus Limnocylindria bacterium]|nr:type II secretion system protein GspK [Candidatus Limnocylindria bacterium]